MLGGRRGDESSSSGRNKNGGKKDRYLQKAALKQFWTNKHSWSYPSVQNIVTTTQSINWTLPAAKTGGDGRRLCGNDH